MELFTFIRADLNSYRPITEDGLSYGDSNTSSSTPSLSTQPNFPKSLFLIRPLSATYELNAVASTAQASVSIPEGLDLDAWIVQPPKAVTNGVEQVEEGLGERKKNSKKGKEKATARSKAKGKKLDRGGHANEIVPAQEIIETEEERAERERVSYW